MFWVVFFTVEFLAVAVSVAVGDYGVCLPLMQVCAFYFCVKKSPWKAMPMLVTFAGLLDAVWLHAFPVQLLSILTVVFFTGWWKRFGDLYAWTAVCGAALFCGLSAWCAQLLAQYGASSRTPHGWMSFCEQLLAAVVLMLVIVAILERVLARRVNTGLRDEGEEE